MPKEDIANSPDYRQETLLDKMISKIKDPTTKELATQLKEQTNIMEITYDKAYRHSNHTPENKIEKNIEAYTQAKAEVSQTRAKLKKRAPEILKTFDDTKNEMAQQKQKDQSVKKQEAKQNSDLKDFKKLLTNQKDNLKQYKNVNTFMNRRFNKNKIANAIQNYVTTQVKIDNAIKADQSLYLNTKQERTKLENPPQKLQKAVEEYKQNLSKSLTSHQVKNRRKSTHAALGNLTQHASEKASGSNLSSPSLPKPNHTLGK
ncbi:hypothetical protein UA3_02229 [Enterococcus faecium EnGen0263]|uniref:hypothetical protein n=1 Tax=Enterococcus faecium TaxID=1352 RepID=UPI00032FADE6|nr:hypothetical protein [Enterococcus faecium]EOH54414.1 hypothetical protein UA3_02229 [Enterococcus faecium EnGen0263]